MGEEQTRGRGDGEIGRMGEGAISRHGDAGMGRLGEEQTKESDED